MTRSWTVGLLLLTVAALGGVELAFGATAALEVGLGLLLAAGVVLVTVTQLRWAAGWVQRPPEQRASHAPLVQKSLLFALVGLAAIAGGAVSGGVIFVASGVGTVLFVVWLRWRAK